MLDVVKDDVKVNSVVKEENVKDDLNFNSVVKEEIDNDDVHVESFVKEDIEKDAEQIENETLPRQKFLGKAYLSPYIQPPSTEVKYRKRRREITFGKVSKKVMKTFVGSDRVEIKLLPWKEVCVYNIIE